MNICIYPPKFVQLTHKTHSWLIKPLINWDSNENTGEKYWIETGNQFCTNLLAVSPSKSIQQWFDSCLNPIVKNAINDFFYIPFLNFLAHLSLKCREYPTKSNADSTSFGVAFKLISVYRDKNRNRYHILKVKPTSRAYLETSSFHELLVSFEICSQTVKFFRFSFVQNVNMSAGNERLSPLVYSNRRSMRAGKLRLLCGPVWVFKIK